MDTRGHYVRPHCLRVSVDFVGPGLLVGPRTSVCQSPINQGRPAARAMTTSMCLRMASSSAAIFKANAAVRKAGKYQVIKVAAQHGGLRKGAGRPKGSRNRATIGVSAMFEDLPCVTCRSNMRLVASQTAATPPRHASPKKSNPVYPSKLCLSPTAVFSGGLPRNDECGVRRPT